ncbi:unnamed protein product [Calypogeia fissa]
MLSPTIGAYGHYLK